MAARRPFWKWHRWKSIGFCLWPPSTCIWNLKLKFQSKLDLCSGNHVVYRQTDGQTDRRTRWIQYTPPPTSLGGGITILRSNIFLKNTVDTNPRLSPSHFNATGCRLWSTGSDRSQSSVVNSMQMGPSEIAVVQISRTKYIMKCYHDMVDQIPPKRILWPWNQWESHCLHRRPHIWNSRTSGASHHQNTRELPLEQKVNLHQVGDPIKRHTNLFKYGYISYV